MLLSTIIAEAKINLLKTNPRIVYLQIDGGNENNNEIVLALCEW